MVVKEATEISQSMIVMDCEVSQSLCESDGVETAQKVSGVTVTFERGETIYFPDVSAKKEKAEGLAALLQGKDLLPQALYDVVFDFVYGEDA